MSRLDVRKTYKLYIGGAFPRSESGRSYPAISSEGDVLARVARASRKDLRMAVEAARKAQPGWAGRTGYNRGQILYRVAEMLEDRHETFVDQIAAGGGTTDHAATNEVDAVIDTMVWYAGWADKFAQVHGNLNPVAGPYFNISAPEPTGVIGAVVPDQPALLGLVSRIAPIIVTGNTVVVIASETQPMPAISFTEVLATSDLPGGVVNLLTGSRDELLPWMADHGNVDGLDVIGADPSQRRRLQEGGALDVKRVVGVRGEVTDRNPQLIAAFTETKTVWHPKGR